MSFWLTPIGVLIIYFLFIPLKLCEAWCLGVLVAFFLTSRRRLKDWKIHLKTMVDNYPHIIPVRSFRLKLTWTNGIEVCFFILNLHVRNHKQGCKCSDILKQFDGQKIKIYYFAVAFVGLSAAYNRQTWASAPRTLYLQCRKWETFPWVPWEVQYLQFRICFFLIRRPKHWFTKGNPCRSLLQ